MVDWAGLEIRSLSQDRGFESLSLLETKGNPYMGFLFVLTQVGMRTLGEGSINCAKAKQTQRS